MGKAATPAARAYGKGLESLSSGRLAEAEEAFRRSNQLDPALGIGFVGLAQIAVMNNRNQQAEELLRKAVQTAPRHAGIQAAWARFLEYRQRWPEAEAAYRSSIALDGKAADVHVSLADVLVKGSDRLTEAVEIYRNALKLDPSDASGYYGLGVALTKLRRMGEARAAFEKAAQLSPNNPVPHHTLGELYLAQKETDAALKAFGAALAANPKFFMAHVSRGDIFMDRGDGARAIAEYEAAAAAAPDSPLPKVKAGMAYQAQGRTREARERYLAALKLDPNQTVALNNLAWMAVQAHTELGKALQWSTKAVALNPKHAALLDTHGWVQYANGDSAAALRTLQRAVQADPAYPGSHYHLGVVLEQTGRKPEGEASLRRALELSPSFDGAADARARLAKLRQK